MYIVTSIYIYIYMLTWMSCVFSKMDQNGAVAIYKKSYHELPLSGEAPVCSSTIIGSEAYVLPGLTNSPVGPSSRWVLGSSHGLLRLVSLRLPADCRPVAGTRLTGRSGETFFLDPFRMGKCRRIQENAMVTGSCFVYFRMKFESKERSQLWCRMI